MRVAVDVHIGIHGAAELRNAGHEVVVIAAAGESDREWFARAMRMRTDAVISPDTDLEILCYDANVAFFKAWTHRGLTGKEVARAFCKRFPALVK